MLIKAYLEQLSDMTKQEFFKYQLNLYKNIKIQSYKDHPEVKKVVDSFLKGFTPRIKDCYRTSLMMAGFDHRFKYICGYTHYVIPIEHAWNSFGDFHFDLTAELALEKEFEEYGIIQTLKYSDVVEAMDDNLPPTMSEIFIAEKKRERK